MTTTTATRKCRTCFGYGMWVLGDGNPRLAPMGSLDAGEGRPTLPCPECGANANPGKGKKP